MLFRVKHGLLMGIAASVVLMACGEKKPTDVAKVFYEQIAQNKVNDAMTLLDSNFIAIFGDHDKTKALVIDYMVKEFEQHQGLERIVTSNESINGDRGGLKLVLHFKDGQTLNQEVQLVKRQDAWKITLDRPDLNKPIPGLNPSLNALEAEKPATNNSAPVSEQSAKTEPSKPAANNPVELNSTTPKVDVPNASSSTTTQPAAVNAQPSKK